LEEKQSVFETSLKGIILVILGKEPKILLSSCDYGIHPPTKPPLHSTPFIFTQSFIQSE
jgi:hypothetical protein